MRKLFVVAAALFMFIPFVSGQSNVEEIEYFQAIFGSEKKAIVAAFVNLEGDAIKAFWTTYDQYETERKTLGKNRMVLLEKYAETYEGMTDEQTDEIIAAMSKQRKSLDKLIDSYYKKIKKVSGSKAAAQFFQLEHYFLAAIRLSILENIPVIGELDN
jgi:hypothetical protein